MSDRSVIIPTYNERENIEPLIHECLRNTDGELIIVDDNSPDGTAEVARSSFARNNRVRVCVRSAERGRAGAVIKGISLAEGQHVAVMDADFSHPPEKLQELFSVLLEYNADVIYATRAGPTGIDERGIQRRLVSKVGSALVKICFPKLRGVSEPLSEYFVLDTNLLDKISLSGRGSKLLFEILLQTDRDSVHEIPYRFTKRRDGDPKFGIQVVLEFVHHVLNLQLQISGGN